jgi:hypothetical protein
LSKLIAVSNAHNLHFAIIDSGVGETVVANFSFIYQGVQQVGCVEEDNDALLYL